MKEKNKIICNQLLVVDWIFFWDTCLSLPKIKIKSTIGIHRLGLDVDNRTTLVWTYDLLYSQGPKTGYTNEQSAMEWLDLQTTENFE
jgi:hypothetical protein